MKYLEEWKGYVSKGVDPVAAAILCVADAVDNIGSILTEALGEDETLYRVLVNAGRELRDDDGDDGDGGVLAPRDEIARGLQAELAAFAGGN